MLILAQTANDWIPNVRLMIADDLTKGRCIVEKVMVVVSGGGRRQGEKMSINCSWR